MVDNALSWSVYILSIIILFNHDALASLLARIKRLKIDYVEINEDWRPCSWKFWVPLGSFWFWFQHINCRIIKCFICFAYSITRKEQVINFQYMNTQIQYTYHINMEWHLEERSVVHIVWSKYQFSSSCNEMAWWVN